MVLLTIETLLPIMEVLCIIVQEESMKLLLFLVLLSQISFSQVKVSGELKIWHNVTITFDGPNSSESARLNPFTSYRLNVTFTNGTVTYTVPGYYAADGNASETGSVSGNKWRVHFVPDRTGTWRYKASFRTGNYIAVNTSPTAGSPVSFNGKEGSFYIGFSDKKVPDFRAKGMLKYSGKRYLQFAGTKDYFIKGGSNSPENFLAYYEFDDTPAKHRFTAHAGDWKYGDPTWKGGKGKNIIGALNYLSSKGVNSLYMLTYNIGGDGKDVWMYNSQSTKVRFDCSKLGQWEVVFSHMDRLGILCHFVTQETENEFFLNNGNLGNERKLYYREMVARFGHHLGVVWNLGEENTNTTDQQKSYANYIKAIDPYDHMVTVHSQAYFRYQALYGFKNIDGPSLYVYKPEQTHAKTIQYLSESVKAGKQWVLSVDEIGPADIAVPPDNIDYWHDKDRKQVLWASLMGGGAGVEWYMGYAHPHNDLKMEDFRSRDHLWELTTIAREFFQRNLPFNNMTSADNLINGSLNYCLAKEGEVYAIYLSNGGTTSLNVRTSGTYSVMWFNPRYGGSLRTGSVTRINGTGYKSIGYPPADRSKDWLAVIRKVVSKDQTEDTETAEMDYKLFNNYPNPFNASTSIKYMIPEAAHVRLSVYDVLGNLITRLVDEQQSAGTYNSQWNAGEVATGVYIFRIETEKFTQTIKTLLLK